jgi:hypothetical protein
MPIVAHYRLGGFVISEETAADWASRITGKTLTGNQFWAIQKAIDPKVRPFKARFELMEGSWEEMAFMVVMRSERLIGYKKGDPVPQFEEGEREAMAKPLLEGEGQSIVIDWITYLTCDCRSDRLCVQDSS